MPGNVTGECRATQSFLLREKIGKITPQIGDGATSGSGASCRHSATFHGFHSSRFSLRKGAVNLRYQRRRSLDILYSCVRSTRHPLLWIVSGRSTPQFSLIQTLTCRSAERQDKPSRNPQLIE